MMRYLLISYRDDELQIVNNRLFIDYRVALSPDVTFFAFASHEGVLYGVSETDLYTINPTTGVTLRVGNSYQFGVGERAPRGFSKS